MTEVSRIERVYRYLGLTQKQFAEQLGFSPKMIKNYSTGTPISSKFIAAIEREFPQISIDYLRNKASEMVAVESKTEVRESVEDYRGCSQCRHKDEMIRELHKRLQDKEDLISVLKDQVQLYKEKLGNCDGLSKQA